MTKEINARLLTRMDTAAAWAISNPLLLRGEQGIESDTRFSKYGNGTHRWNDLPYARAQGGAIATTAEPSAASTNDEVTAASTLWNMLGQNRQSLDTESKQIIPAINEAYNRLGDFDWAGEDFYSEGTFALQLRAGDTAVVPITIQQNTYTRTGNRVVLNGSVTVTRGNMPDGVLQLRGLPFPPLIRPSELPVGNANFQADPLNIFTMFGYWSGPFFTFRRAWDGDMWLHGLPTTASRIHFTCNYQVAR